MTEYVIQQFPGRITVVIDEDPPPCMRCGKPVPGWSMDGPLVCGWCDMGENRDGTKWTKEDEKRVRAHTVAYIEKYRKE